MVLVCDVCRKAFKQDGVVTCVVTFQAGWCL